MKRTKTDPSLKTVGDCWEITEKYGLGKPFGEWKGIDVFDLATALLKAERKELTPKNN